MSLYGLNHYPAALTFGALGARGSGVGGRPRTDTCPPRSERSAPPSFGRVPCDACPRRAERASGCPQHGCVYRGPRARSREISGCARKPRTRKRLGAWFGRCAQASSAFQAVPASDGGSAARRRLGKTASDPSEHTDSRPGATSCCGRDIEGLHGSRVLDRLSKPGFPAMRRLRGSAREAAPLCDPCTRDRRTRALEGGRHHPSRGVPPWLLVPMTLVFAGTPWRLRGRCHQACTRIGRAHAQTGRPPPMPGGPASRKTELLAAGDVLAAFLRGLRPLGLPPRATMSWQSTLPS